MISVVELWTSPPAMDALHGQNKKLALLRRHPGTDLGLCDGYKLLLLHCPSTIPLKVTDPSPLTVVNHT